VSDRLDNQPSPRRVAIIGGGAAGYFGAIAAAEQDGAAEVVLLEATRQPLDKVRISGGGRCNVTHNCFEPRELAKNYPRGSKELAGLYYRFQPRDTIAWFARHGVTLKAEPDGRMFPTTDQSSTIIECLTQAAAAAGVRVHLGARVKSLRIGQDMEGRRQFEIAVHDAPDVQADAVLLATGSSPQGYRLAEELGHSIVPCVPSLFTFKITDPLLDGLSGISFPKVALRLIDSEGKKLEQIGPMLITHWGLSGPAVLKLSAWGARTLHRDGYRARLVANFLPDETAESVLARLSAYRSEHGTKRVEADPVFPLPRRFWARIAELSGIAPDTTWTHVTRNQTTALVAALTHSEFSVAGKGQFKEEFVTCGGVSLKEVDFATMQSRVCPGLYLAGEVLDIDGVTGGFNFQSAWSSGWIAGTAMVAV